MFFSIKNPYDMPVEALKIRTLASARRKLFLFPFHATEIFIDKYLLKEFGIGLRQACLHIFHNCQIQKAEGNSAIILIPDKRLDKIASLITYGPGGACGSKILQVAFYNI